jgi:hypothetical protein
MRRIILLALTIGFLAPLLASAPAQAQATRTWVSGVGDDANPCSRTAPCKTFAGAISKTAVSGEIDCLDPGGFGGITITKAITLNCTATLGSILVAGTPGISISAGTSDIVVIRGLQLQGLGPTGGAPGTVGIQINSAATVSIESSVITQFSQQGIRDGRTAGGTKLLIKDTLISHNGGNGIDLTAASANSVLIANTHSFNNAIGLHAATGNYATVKHSVFSDNAKIATSAGVAGDSGSLIQLDDVALSSNTNGITASGGNVRLSNSVVSFNSTAFNGAATTYGNNQVFGNATLGTGPTAAGGASSDLGEQ